MNRFPAKLLVPKIVRRSFAWKFILATTAVIILTSLLLTFFLLRNHRAVRYQQLRELGLSLAENMAYNSELPVLIEDRETLNRLQQGVIREPDIFYCRIEKFPDRVLVEVGEPPPVSRPPPRPVSRITTPETLRFPETGNEIEGYEIVVPITTLARRPVSREEIAFPEVSNGEEINQRPAGPEEDGLPVETIGAITLGVSAARLNREIQAAHQTAVTITFFTVVLGIMLMAGVTKVVTLPIEKLIEGTQRLARGDFSHRVSVRSSDEIGALARSFNMMADSVRKSRQRLQDYSRDLEEQVSERTRALRASNEELKILNQVAFSISRSIDLDVTLSQIAEEAPKVIGGTNCFLFLYDERQKELRPVAASSDVWPLIRDVVIKEGQTSGAMRALKTKTIITVQDTLHSSEIITRLARKFGQKSLVFAPLVIRDRAIGVMVLDDVERNRDFTDQELERVQTIASQASIAIHNSRLYANLEKSLQELKASQERLIRSEKFAAVGELLTGITHEINNKLAPILGYAELLQMRSFDDESMKMLKTIESAALSSKAIIESLLTFARPQKPKKRYRDVNEIIRGVLDLLSYKMKSSGVKINKDLDSNLPSTMVDVDQIGQVFLNVFNNAQQAMEESREKELRISSWSEGDQLKFKISDSGPGISDEKRNRIFDPFFTTKRPGKGSGLGLSICYQIVRSHRGEITVESEDGRGTSFIISLPVEHRPEEKPEVTPSPEGKEPAGGGRILVVDDEAATVKLLSSVLSSSFRVETAVAGREALEKLQRREYDLVLLDLRMPGINGRDIYNWLKENRPSRERKIIFMTGDTFEPQTREFIKQTGNRVLLKPFRIKDLKETIARASSPAGK